MSKYWLGLVVTLMVTLIGCSTGSLHGPPVTNSPLPEGTIPAQSAEPATIADLAASPADYEGLYLEVSGRFRQAPVVACETKHMRSPATWGLGEEELTIAAAGPASRYPQLGGDQPILSVTGYWRRWYGAVGCGRQAPVTEVWYLDVDRLLSPNPIALVPTAIAGSTAGGLTNPQGTPVEVEPDLGLTAVSTATISAPSPPVAVTSPAGVTTGDAYPGPGTTQTAQAGGATVTVGATPSPLNTAGAATTTPSATATAVATESETTPIVTATVGADGTPTIEDQIELEPGSLETGLLNGNQIDRWPVTITATTAITVNLASELGLDVAFQVRDSNGNLLAEQDGAADGQPEFLGDIELPGAGTYELLVSSPDNGSGHYAILMNSTDSYYFRFQGTISYGDTRSGSALAFNDHLWHFTGTAGNTIAVIVSPGDNFNMFIRLFGPDASTLVGFHNESGAGEDETLTFTLPESGFYSLLIGETDFRAVDYQITLNGE